MLYQRDFSKIEFSPNDPYIMYFVIKDSVRLSPAKLAIQIAHGLELYLVEVLTQLDSFQLSYFNEWQKHGARKVLLSASDKEFEKIKKIQDYDIFLVEDMGLTEVDPFTETVIAFSPINKSAAPKILKKLRLL